MDLVTNLELLHGNNALVLDLNSGVTSKAGDDGWAKLLIELCALKVAHHAGTHVDVGDQRRNASPARGFAIQAVAWNFVARRSNVGLGDRAKWMVLWIGVWGKRRGALEHSILKASALKNILGIFSVLAVLTGRWTSTVACNLRLGCWTSDVVVGIGTWDALFSTEEGAINASASTNVGDLRASRPVERAVQTVTVDWGGA
jgi:hypothetical protein